ncbi:MAG TPA: hypothetical protein VNK48_10245 [Xanthobacteraceae bacterium]|nr:hypothetical protein [Xanthobacteraceae bacterium]
MRTSLRRERFVSARRNGDHPRLEWRRRTNFRSCRNPHEIRRFDYSARSKIASPSTDHHGEKIRRRGASSRHQTRAFGRGKFFTAGDILAPSKLFICSELSESVTK